MQTVWAGNAGRWETCTPRKTGRGPSHKQPARHRRATRRRRTHRRKVQEAVLARVLGRRVMACLRDGSGRLSPGFNPPPCHFRLSLCGHQRWPGFAAVHSLAKTLAFSPEYWHRVIANPISLNRLARSYLHENAKVLLRLDPQLLRTRFVPLRKSASAGNGRNNPTGIRRPTCGFTG